MIRKLFIVAASGFALSVACLAGAAALVTHDLSAHNWTWSVVKYGDHVSFLKGTQAAPDPVATKTLAWTGGDTLTTDVPYDVVYVQGDTPSVTLSGPASMLNRVTLADGRLSYVAGPEQPEIINFHIGPNGVEAHDNDHDHLKITITAPKISHFAMTGDGDLTLQDYDQPTLDLNLSGSGSVTGTGTTRALTLALSGDGDAHLNGLQTGDADVNVSGSGGTELAATGKAKVDVSGSGDVDFKTKPASVMSHISGTGSVNQD